MCQKIDFVIPWVDGNDPEWIREKNRCLDKTGYEPDAKTIRYRDWDILKYWFRGVEKYAPWVNKIHFITWKHIPSWLNLHHPKLHIVNHKDYIPAKYLPTFSSHAIELNMHRIPGLSENFVYFNDDMFILKPLREEDFFVGGIPCDICVSDAAPSGQDVYSAIVRNDIACINKHFNRKESIKKNPLGWFSPKYGSKSLHTLRTLWQEHFSGFWDHHLPSAYKKETLETVWANEKDLLDATCLHRFRSSSDVNQYIFRYWRLASGEFVPHERLGKCYQIGEEKIFKIIKNQSVKLFCINDGDESADVDFDKEKLRLIDAFETILPEKSGYETE